MVGMFAISLAGHDKGKLYVIIKEDGEYAYLADGRIRLLSNLKKKKLKHLQLIKTGLDEELAGRLKNGRTVTDEEIKYVIKVRTGKNKEEANVKG